MIEIERVLVSDLPSHLEQIYCTLVVKEHYRMAFLVVFCVHATFVSTRVPGWTSLPQ